MTSTFIPSQTIILSSYNERDIFDSKGRKITLRNLNSLDRLRLFKAIGGELSENAMYFCMASIAVSVTAIDNMPIPFPTNELQLEQLVSQLGDDGITAVALATELQTDSAMERVQQGN